MNNKEYTDLVESENFPSEPFVPIDLPFVNDAGTIQNLLNCNIGSAAIITSKKGSERSNHFHLKSWHFLYVISGALKYFERNLDGSDILIKEYNKGEMFFTPPNKVHKVEFLSDCVLLSLGRFSKDHESHEKDIVREKF